MVQILGVIGIVLVFICMYVLHKILKDSNIPENKVMQINVVTTLLMFICMCALSYIVFS